METLRESLSKLCGSAEEGNLVWVRVGGKWEGSEKASGSVCEQVKLSQIRVIKKKLHIQKERGQSVCVCVSALP